MTMHQFFDPHNLRHLEAYHHLQATGVWPAWFWEETQQQGVRFNEGWSIIINYKMAQAWLDYKLPDISEDQ